MSSFAVERLDHLGLVAGVCQDIGLVEYFDRLDDQAHARVSLGQAVLAMMLNGLGFSNRRLYLIPQFFAHKPIERLLGPGITADESPRRLPGASAGLAHGPRSDRAVCWASLSSAPAFWSRGRGGACRQHLLLR